MQQQQHHRGSHHERPRHQRGPGLRADGGPAGGLHLLPGAGAGGRGGGGRPLHLGVRRHHQPPHLHRGRLGRRPAPSLSLPRPARNLGRPPLQPAPGGVWRGGGRDLLHPGVRGAPRPGGHLRHGNVEQAARGSCVSTIIMIDKESGNALFITMKGIMNYKINI